MKGYLIAETNELGRVEWVWVYRKTERNLKPVQRNTFQVTELSHFDIHGAHKTEIVSWLESGNQQPG